MLLLSVNLCWALTRARDTKKQGLLAIILESMSVAVPTTLRPAVELELAIEL
jgi:hypothetical protein